MNEALSAGAGAKSLSRRSEQGCGGGGTSEGVS